MKTKFFYLAVAVMTAFCTTACSSDDDDNGGGSNTNGKSVIQTPKYADKACKLTPSRPIELANGYTLENIEMGESGRCYVLLKDEKKEDIALNANYFCNDNVYSVEGNKVSGTVKVQSTRASENVKLIVKLNIILDGKTIICDTDVDGGIDAIKLVGNVSGGDPDVISTWKVRTKTSEGLPAGLLIDLKGDVNLFKTFSGGDLRNIRNEAEAQGAEFTAEERKDFEKTLTYVTFTNDYITLDYDDGTSDCGTWSWAGSEAKKFNLKMLSANMGNKFIITNTTAGIAFNKADGFLNVTLNADITGNKNYTATLTIQLEQAPEVK
jgi:hypothetical protein